MSYTEQTQSIQFHKAVSSLCPEMLSRDQMHPAAGYELGPYSEQTSPRGTPGSFPEGRFDLFLKSLEEVFVLLLLSSST